MTDQERARTLKFRKEQHHPWHSPPHFDLQGNGIYMVSASCYEHAPIIGRSIERLFECEKAIVDICAELGKEVFAWCILPNHYHILVSSDDVVELRKGLGRHHGRTSRKWNLQDGLTGRKVWHNCVERSMQSERHFFATLNYIHNNPVKHGYVAVWQDWQFSSAEQFLEQVGREYAAHIWDEYPIGEYGKEWDP